MYPMNISYLPKTYYKYRSLLLSFIHVYVCTIYNSHLYISATVYKYLAYKLASHFFCSWANSYDCTWLLSLRLHFINHQHFMFMTTISSKNWGPVVYWIFMYMYMYMDHNHVLLILTQTYMYMYTAHLKLLCLCSG